MQTFTNRLPLRWNLELRLDARPRSLRFACADDIERMGYKALIYKTDSLNAIGLPIGWDAKTVIDPQHVTVSQYRTTHVVPY